jgi:hypothetical protein
MNRGPKAQRRKGSKKSRKASKTKSRKGKTSGHAFVRKTLSELKQYPLGGTPDGISGDDWSRVYQLTVDLFCAKPQARKQLLNWLDELQGKYGELPSILATRADFSPLVNKEQLLRRAYSLSTARGDRSNQLHVAHSLTEYCVDESRNDIEGRKWLDVLKGHLAEIADASYEHDYERMLEKLVRPARRRR